MVSVSATAKYAAASTGGSSRPGSTLSTSTSLSMVEMKQVGVGLGAAILLDAVVVRIVLLPSLMTLLGRADWWPSRLSRPTPGRHQRPAGEPEPHELERQPS